MSDTYQCSVCNGVFKKGWSESEAIAEMEKNWPKIPMREMAVVCNDCFNRLLSDRKADT